MGPGLYLEKEDEENLFFRQKNRCKLGKFWKKLRSEKSFGNY
tara:strand:- start:126 stop:251 length:126 start_codon:yes stop_codon:yes gene_type:complete